MKDTPKSRCERRVKQAAGTLKKIEVILARLQKVPSFRGKAGVIDAALAAKTWAHNLHWDLSRDLDELRDKPRG
jgi:hypothetical protein